MEGQCKSAMLFMVRWWEHVKASFGTQREAGLRILPTYETPPAPAAASPAARRIRW